VCEWAVREQDVRGLAHDNRQTVFRINHPPLLSHTLVAMQCFALSHTGGHAVLCSLSHWWPCSALLSHTLVAMQCFALSHTGGHAVPASATFALSHAGGHAVLCSLTRWWPCSALLSHTLVAMQCFALSHTGGHAVPASAMNQSKARVWVKFHASVNHHAQSCCKINGPFTHDH
jgi:hypothetical protein